jgi:hypothetical protein
MDQKIKTNAFISYFFLGFLFLLAKNNPNFSDPFVRSHAKAATMLHTICLFVVIGVFYGLSPLVSNISLPFVLLRFDQALNSLVCIIVIIVLAIAAARALRGLPPIGFSNV